MYDIILMVKIQILFVALFVLNLLLLWVGKFTWYRFPGYILLLVIPLVTVFFKQPRFELDFFWWRIGGMIAIAIGVGTIFLAKRELRKYEAKWHDVLPKTLVTSGPYSYVRHPMYLGLVFIFVGWWWVWSAAYAFYFGMFILATIWIQGYLEEKWILEKRFGKKYQEYRQRTGMYWIK